MKERKIHSDFYEGTLRVDFDNDKTYFQPDNGGKEYEIDSKSNKATDIKLSREFIFGSTEEDKTDKAVAR